MMTTIASIPKFTTEIALRTALVADRSSDRGARSFEGTDRRCIGSTRLPPCSMNTFRTERIQGVVPVGVFRPRRPRLWRAMPPAPIVVGGQLDDRLAIGGSRSGLMVPAPGVSVGVTRNRRHQTIGDGRRCSNFWPGAVPDRRGAVWWRGGATAATIAAKDSQPTAGNQKKRRIGTRITTAITSQNAASGDRLRKAPMATKR